MPTYSHSKISTFEQCPLKYKFSYIDKIETEIEETVEAFLGSRVHETLQKLYTDLNFQMMPSLKELLDFFNSQWKKNWNDAIVIVREEYGQENYRKMGERYITDYYTRYEPFNQERTIELETMRMVPLDNAYQIHIRVDRLAEKDGIYEIHDYKTSQSLPTQDDLDKDRQLAVYAYGIKRMYPDARKIQLIWHFLATDEEMRSERTEEQLDVLKKEVIESIKEIESAREFPASVSPLCEWCEFRPLCPEWKHLYQIEDKPANEYLNDDGVKIVNRYAEVYEQIKKNESDLERLREALIAYAKKHEVNAVFGSDVKASVRSYDKLKFPGKNDPAREELDKLIKKLGLWDELAVLDTYELAKRINSRGLRDDFLKLIQKFTVKEIMDVVRLGRK